MARELEVVARCATRSHESTQYSSSLTRGINLVWLTVVVAFIFFVPARKLGNFYDG